MSTVEYLQRVPEGMGYVDGTYRPIREIMVSIADLGYTQNAATYDVARVSNGKFFRLDWHLERFFQSAQGLYLPLQYTPEQVTEILRECVIRSGHENAFVWMGVMQGIPLTGNPRAYDEAETRFYAYSKGYYGISNEKGNQPTGVNISISNIQRIPPESVDPRLKNHDWLDTRRAQIEAKSQGYDTTVLIDSRGNVSEGPGFNVCAVRDGTVMTSKGNALEGITLRAIEMISDELEIPFERKDISPPELRSAEEVFLSSTSGGITPVLSIDRQPLSGTGVVTARLIDAYWDKHTDPAWSLPVKV